MENLKWILISLFVLGALVYVGTEDYKSEMIRRSTPEYRAQVEEQANFYAWMNQPKYRIHK